MVSSIRGQMDEHCSVSVRKIKNGYLVSKSVSGPNQKYSHEEEYHERKPNIDVFSIPNLGTGVKSGKVNANSLRKAAGNRKVKTT